jgi:nucleotide-binding universal stress UspA family protein
MRAAAATRMLLGMSSVFERILCGIDQRLESVEAAREVALVAPPGARITLVTVTQPVAAAAPGFGALTVPLLRERREAEETLERARTGVAELRGAESAILEGAPIPTLLAAAAKGPTLVVVGIHHESRAAGIALGSVATALLHDAPCSVYVGRGRFGVAGPPRTIAVGIDGSPAARAAYLAARELAERIGARLETVVALGGRPPSLEAAREDAGATLREDSRGPVDALLAAEADLLVVGSRGLHGIHALGSVSERIAHRAAGPVLVVREAAPRVASAR